MITLSVLDQSPVSSGYTAQDALKQTVELAKWTDELGYNRFWVAEHHNTNGLAGSSPLLMMTHLASQTSHIRIGSGGVLLPQYSSYKVAEDVQLLENLYPNRIDLGLGRSPGGDALTRLALTDGVRKSLNEFPRQVQSLIGHLTDSLPREHDFYGVRAFPKSETKPQLWQLGINKRGGRAAGELGISFTFGHFIQPIGGQEAIQSYHDSFVPSSYQQTPHTNVCIFVVCAETEEEATMHAKTLDLWLLKVERGGDTTVPSIDEASRYVYTDEERKKIERNRRRMLVGDVATVKRALLFLQEKYQNDEFLIITNIHDFEAKKKSYALLAEAFKQGKSDNSSL
ncbi:LLM class flavin-dependent oxidoreductase [Metabacillus iocasae]|uniref:Luciferase family oxidoreductase group 1 n=1 Tax=Priestia iocasae TaxID=2291674 RepID=A0ABS2QVZ6_9BACI|nr:LLM class flavin-dependent oxidoreductase [Metabacillus iocasae]MBM7703659.1 luciferase family oxidoreductase group 1 [Metabacillus iocasae]